MHFFLNSLYLENNQHTSILEAMKLKPMIDKELDDLMDYCPSVFRNSIRIRIVKFFTRLIDLVFLLTGFGLLISSFFERLFLERVMRVSLNEVDLFIANYTQFINSLGFGLMLLGTLFLFMTYLGSLILKRNNFIFKTQLWYLQKLEDEKE